MQQVINYYEWKESWWLKHLERQATSNDSIQNGVSAYIQKQAYLCTCLAKSFANSWLPFLKSKGVVPEWESRYNNYQKDFIDSKESIADNDIVDVEDIELDIDKTSFDTFDIYD